MATLIDLVRQNQLIKLEAALSWREQEDRRIYIFPKVRDWMEQTLPDEVSDRGLEITPLEQLDEFLIQYCAGRELMYERQFRPINHIDNGIWELKTPDVRLFGWFSAKDCFVCTAGDTKHRVLKIGLVPGYRDEAVWFRDELALDEPKFIVGDDPHDVISSFSFPPS